MGRPLTAGSAEFVALGGTIAGLAALLPTLGLIGAAWATLVSYSISGLWMAWRIRVITGMPMRKLFTPDREAIAMLRSGCEHQSQARERISSGDEREQRKARQSPRRRRTARGDPRGTVRGMSFDEVKAMDGCLRANTASGS